MRIKQTLSAFVFALAFFGLIFSPLVSAKTGDICGSTTLKDGQSCCGGVVTSIIACEQTGGKDAGTNNTGIWGLLVTAINILTAGIGIVAVAGIVYGAVLYTTAGDKASQVTQAKTVIFEVAVGLVMYALMFSFLNFIIPGGVFK